MIEEKQNDRYTLSLSLFHCCSFQNIRGNDEKLSKMIINKRNSYITKQ
jgi:hypothetical protein